MLIKICNNRRLFILAALALACLYTPSSFAKTFLYIPIVMHTDSSTRLGGSNYFVTLPTGFTIIEGQGKEGQLGYSIVPNDTALGIYSLMEIKHGAGSRAIIEPSGNKQYIKANFIGKQTTWTIEQDGSVLLARTPNDEVTVVIIAKDMDKIKGMIDLYSTVIKK